MKRLFYTAQPRNRHAQQGSVLIMVIVLLGVLSIVLAGLWRELHRSHNEVERAYRESVAWHHAEAGLHWAAAQLVQGTDAAEILSPEADGTATVTGNALDGTLEAGVTLEFPEGWTDVRFTDSLAGPRYRLVAKGHYGEPGRSVRAVTLEAVMEVSADRAHLRELQVSPVR